MSKNLFYRIYNLFKIKKLPRPNIWWAYKGESFAMPWVCFAIWNGKKYIDGIEINL